MAHKMSWAPRNYACKIVRALRKYLNYVRKLFCASGKNVLSVRKERFERPENVFESQNILKFTDEERFVFGGTTDVYYYYVFCSKAGGKMLLLSFYVFFKVLGVFSCLGDVRGKNNNCISISARVARPSVIVWPPRLAVGPPPTPPPASTSAPAVALKLAFLVLALPPGGVKRPRRPPKTDRFAHARRTRRKTARAV
jgi:hypothetical protein